MNNQGNDYKYELNSNIDNTYHHTPGWKIAEHMIIRRLKYNELLDRITHE